MVAKGCDGASGGRHLAPARPESVRRARHFVADAAGRAGFSPTTIDLAAVAASELVTNAVVHGRGPISVRTVLDRRRCGSRCRTPPPTSRIASTPTTARAGGRGSAIVDAFVARVGLHRRARRGGKSVWFTMERATADAPADRAYFLTMQVSLVSPDAAAVTVTSPLPAARVKVELAVVSEFADVIERLVGLHAPLRRAAGQVHGACGAASSG